MNSQPPPPVGAQQSRYEQPRVMAPTLGDFWRSDVRHTSGRKASRWVGWVAFLLGLVAMATLYTGAVTSNQLLVDISLGFSFTAAFFALIALIAGIGRGAGLFGLLFAVAGNAYVIGWLGQQFT